MKLVTRQRALVYGPLALLCATAGIWLGTAAAIWSFVQVLAVIELTQLLGVLTAPDHSIQPR